MTQSAKAQEPSMEEILASIRRIIADDDQAKPAVPPKPAAPVAATPPPRPVVVPPPQPAPPPAPAASNSQNEIDALLAERDAPVAEPAADVLDLTESMAEPPPAPQAHAAPQGYAPSFQTIDGQPDVVFSDAPPEPREEPRHHAPPPSYDRGLLSGSATAAVDSAFNSLAQTVLVHNARTLEDLVREMLRPMLKTWLDDNLPGMVERLVRAEIERVSRSRGA